MALLGYDPMKYYCGRGTLECMGFDTYKKYKYFVGFRLNFASLNIRDYCLNRRTARDISEIELKELTCLISKGIKINSNEDIEYDLKTFGKYRGILSFYSNNEKLSGNVTNTDPGFQKIGYFSMPLKDYIPIPAKCIPLDDTDSSKKVARIINDFSEQCIKLLSKCELNRIREKQGRLPVNCILVRDGGKKQIPMPSFQEKYGIDLSIYGQLPCEKAIAKAIQSEFHYTRALELQLDDDYLKELADLMVKAPAHVVLCHLKGPDEPGHDNNPMGKVIAIEKIDQYFISEIIRRKKEDDIVIVTCDHATPCKLGMHSADYVPLLLCGKGIKADKCKCFDEYSARIGECKIKRAVDILSILNSIKNISI